MSERIVDRFVLLDVDRTILKSTTFVEKYVYPALLKLYADSQYAQQMIEAVRVEERQNRSQAFDYLAVYAEYMQQGDDRPLTYQRLAEEILRRVRTDQGAIEQSFIHDILVDGSLDLVQVLAAKAFWGFLTTGGPETQNLKLAIIKQIVIQELGVSPRGLVIASEQKAHMIETVWYDPSRQVFRIPDELSEVGAPIYARHITMIDDKPKNLHHAHDDISTHLVNAAEATVVDDEGRGPRQTLYEVIATLSK